MLNDHSGIGHKRPKIVRTHARIPLKMIQKRLCICIIIRVWQRANSSAIQGNRQGRTGWMDEWTNMTASPITTSSKLPSASSAGCIPLESCALPWAAGQHLVHPPLQEARAHSTRPREPVDLDQGALAAAMGFFESHYLFDLDAFRQESAAGIQAPSLEKYSGLSTHTENRATQFRAQPVLPISNGHVRVSPSRA